METTKLETLLERLAVAVERLADAAEQQAATLHKIDEISLDSIYARLAEIAARV